MKTLEIVLKITERCNINCSYCYVFNKSDTSSISRPPILKKKVLEGLIDFVSKAIDSDGFEKIMFDFHGGEPLLLGKSKFREMCQFIVDELNDKVNLSFALQTNAILIDKEWIDIFSEFNICIGVSLDGDEEVNDAERVDFNGRGTYKRTLAGLEVLKKAYANKKISHLGILTVFNPKVDVKKVIDHFLNDLGIEDFTFLLPIDSHETFNTALSELYEKSLADVVKYFFEECKGKASIRLVKDALIFFAGGKREIDRYFEAKDNDHIIITVASNGDFGPDDTLRCIDELDFWGLNILTTNFSEYKQSSIFKRLIEEERFLPDNCLKCAWQNVCKGGASNGRLVNRYSIKNGFNNESIICSALKVFYSEISKQLLDNGFGYSRLVNNLLAENTNLKSYPKYGNESDNQLIHRQKI